MKGAVFTGYDMDVYNKIKNILSEILDIDEKTITEETYIIRDLGAESIDLMEVAVAINSHFKIDVSDNVLYLRKFRIFINEAEEQGADVTGALARQYPYLTKDRIEQMRADLENGPVLQVRDLVAYIEGAGK